MRAGSGFSATHSPSPTMSVAPNSSLRSLFGWLDRQLIAHEEGHQTATVITFPWLIYLTSVRTSLDLCELVATPLVDIIGTAVGIANFASAGPCDRCQELPHGRRHSSILSISASLNVFPALLMITARLVLHNRNIRTAMAAQNEAEPLST